MQLGPAISNELILFDSSWLDTEIGKEKTGCQATDLNHQVESSLVSTNWRLSHIVDQ